MLIEMKKKKKISIKLMPDFQCDPLWWGKDSAKVGNIDPNTLPISSFLKKKLFDWAKQFDSTLNLKEPNQSTEFEDLNMVKFQEEGKNIKYLLECEIGHKYQIEYCLPSFEKKKQNISEINLSY
ncbi:hypothetical protein [Candidatus Lokiarchaeum ossiferum]|uniref:hypothetical protein n=1 Tax=Candidatus Lokiarchaeum ossiferum TaxID=2951803 RepID=UPI00352F637A